MDKLSNYDMFVGGTKRQYQDIAKESGVDAGLFVENALIRGGCFWSERYKIPVPGILSNGYQLKHSEFILRLKISKA